MWYGYLFILITQGSGSHCIVANKCITRRGLTSQTYLLPSLFYSALRVWVQRRSGSPLKHPLDGYPIRLGPFPPFRILSGPPLAIIDEMKVTDGEYEGAARMDGPPVRPRQRPPQRRGHKYAFACQSFEKDILGLSGWWGGSGV